MVNARMTEGLYGQIELNPPHWVLQERQLVNWGSYGGLPHLRSLHDV